MLRVILETIENAGVGATPQVTPQVECLISALHQAGKPLNRSELQTRLSLKDRESFRERYLQPALAAGLIEPKFLS